MSSFNNLKREVMKRLFFGSKVRRDAWNLIADMLDTDMDFSKTLNVLYEIAVENNQRGRAAVLLDLKNAAKGDFGREVTQYVSSSEAILFSTWDHSPPIALFRSAARLLDVQQKQWAAVKSNLAMPFLLTIGVMFLVIGFARWFIPEFANVRPLEHWPANAQLFAQIGMVINQNIISVILALPLAVCLLLLLLRYWTGVGRATADRFPPFSIYRTFEGAAFLFTLVEYVKAGFDVNRKTLARLASAASPYGRSRINAIALNIHHGPGNAMRRTGHKFPDPELIPYIMALGNIRDWEHSLSRYLDSWLENAKARFETRMKALNFILLMIVAVVLSTIVSVVFSLVESLDQIGSQF